MFSTLLQHADRVDSLNSRELQRLEARELKCELSSLIPGPGRRFEMISLVGNRRFSSDKVQDNCKYSDMLCKGPTVFPSASPVRHQLSGRVPEIGGRDQSHLSAFRWFELSGLVHTCMHVWGPPSSAVIPCLQKQAGTINFE